MQLLTCPWTLTVTMRASHQLRMSKESSISNCSGKNTDTHPLADMCLDFALWFSESVMHDEMLNLSFMFVGFRILWEEASKEIWPQKKGQSGGIATKCTFILKSSSGATECWSKCVKSVVRVWEFCSSNFYGSGELVFLCQTLHAKTWLVHVHLPKCAF